MGALTGSLDEEIVAEAMLETRMADISEWSSIFFGSTVQKSRREFYKIGSVIKENLGHKTEHIIKGEVLCA